MKEIKINKSSSEIYGGIFLSVFSLLLYFIIIPSQIKEVKKAVVSPQTLPKILAIFMLLLSILLIIEGFRKKDFKEQKVYKVTISELKLVLISILIIVVYILVVEYLGYIITTSISIAILMYLFGQRKITTIILTSILVPIIINVFFSNLMKIYLP